MDGVTSGNVFGYNYILAQAVSSADNRLQHNAIAFHGAHPSMNLFEGNIWRGSMYADYYHGSSSHNTFFRNQGYLESQAGTRRNFLFNLFKKAQYYNVVGNVLGTVGLEAFYEGTGRTLDYGDPGYVYTLGYPSAGFAWITNTIPYGPSDTQVKATFYRHGNWDSVNNAVIWESSNSDHSLPVSLYLSSKPSFFGNCAWPSIGPDLNPMAGVLPAKARYEGSLICGETALRSPANFRMSN